MYILLIIIIIIFFYQNLITKCQNPPHFSHDNSPFIGISLKQLDI